MGLTSLRTFNNQLRWWRFGRRACIASTLLLAASATAQTPPGAAQIAAYSGLHRAAQLADIERIKPLLDSGVDLEARDAAGRTAMLIAAFASHEDTVIALARAGANMNAMDAQAYDAVTIAAVANDIEMLDVLLSQGASAANITSPYDGTALIAAAHLGHHRVVDRLIRAGAPLDHINNLTWTALMEAVVLGDGGADHTETVRLLLAAGADRSIADRDGVVPREHAAARGYDKILHLFDSTH